MKRLLTGYRPTGALHIGHYWGNLCNMVELQDQYECFYFIAEWHALTTAYEETQELAQASRDIVLEWMAAGIDPKKATIYRQSSIPEVAELSMYLSMITPVSWLERNPTYKDMIRELAGKEITTLGFLGYPVWQTADIIIVHSELVPVGEDQLPHLEIAREIVRRFNYLYGDYFPEPQALLSEARRVPGTDGRKMSKSFGNAIFLSDPPDVVWEKLRTMMTDPARVRRTDPGTPEICPVYHLHKLYDPENTELVAHNCRTAGWGCIECKRLLADHLIPQLVKFQERKKELSEDPGLVDRVLEEGAERVRSIARETIREVRSRLHL